MVVSDTRDCFRACIGKRVTGVLFGLLPAMRSDLARGNKTLVFEDGSGLTISNDGSFWMDNPEEIERAVAHREAALRAIEAERMLAVAVSENRISMDATSVSKAPWAPLAQSCLEEAAQQSGRIQRQLVRRVLLLVGQRHRKRRL
jgi:hypothetical protein